MIVDGLKRVQKNFETKIRKIERVIAILSFPFTIILGEYTPFIYGVSSPQGLSIVLAVLLDRFGQSQRITKLFSPYVITIM